MYLINKMFNYFGYEKSRAFTVPVDYTNSNGMGKATPQNYKAYLKQYTDAAWVYTCIQRISSQGAGVAIKLYKKSIQGNKIEYTEVMTHPIISLLRKVNPFMTGADLVETTLSYEELTGNAYWLLDMFENGKPTEIHPLRPDRIKIDPDSRNYIKSYRYEIANGKYITFKPELIIHFKYFNSTDDYYGLSPLSAGRMAIDTQRLGDEYNKSFYANSAQPRGVLFSEKTIEARSKKRIAAAWNQMHRGVSNSHKTAILEGGLEWRSIGISQKDMDFINQKKMTREDIMGVFGVPPAMVGVFEFANYANSKEQREIFWRNTMVPKLNKYIAVINEFLIKPWDETLEVRVDYSSVDALQADMQARAVTDEVLTRSGIKTINEAREERGLHPVEWGNTWRAPLNLSPVDSVPPDKEDDKQLRIEYDKKQKEFEKKSLITIQNKIVQHIIDAGEKVDMSLENVQNIIDSGEAVILEQEEDTTDNVQAKEIRDKKWEVYKDLTETWEKKLLVILTKEFALQREETLANLETVGIKRQPSEHIEQKDAEDRRIDKILFDKKKADKALKKNSKKTFEGTIEANAKKEINALGLGITFDVENPAVQEWIDKKTFKFADEVNTTTQNKLRRELKASIKAGEGIPEAKKRILTIFDSASKGRGTVIARTEVVSASNQGAMAVYEQSDVVKQKEWISARDADVRDEHRIDGEKIGLGGTFSNGLKYPGDPNGTPDNICNCRCTVSGVVKD